MFRPEPATLDQLPRDAAAYYREVEQSPLYHRVLIGTDYCGRRIYQKYLRTQEGIEDEPYGAPRALLTYREFRAKVSSWVRRYPNARMGLDRWTEPTYNG